ncbi:HNH endonuclease [Metabacillus fastidiosus]|uniref:HNH endonuclease n=1 Tax=Metabacillus fastidiosus TaxID=1458 RepID=UPI002DB5C5AF|nr:HNH endonuclease [Metabacillus fastidiosus]MEC2074826.1 HNH endonuclease [Metabacillus fastidiosus]
MNYYIVMQGHSYEEEKALCIIWSQQKDRGDNVPHSWKRMLEVSPGDRVFHYVHGDIVAISTAKSACQTAAKPDGANNGEEGYLVETEYYELEKSLNIKSYFNEIEPLLPLKYSAFQKDGNGNQGYLYPCNELLAIKLLELIADLNIYEEDQEQLEFAIGPVISKEHNNLIPVIVEAEAEAKVKLRKGGQKYKETLAPLWNHQCALCGIDLPAMLRASYSKPWKDSTNEERLDPYNGLLLCHNHEALYAKGYIAFDGTGRIHISERINEADYGKYGIHPKMRVERKEDNKKYFKWHKKNIFV